MKNNKGNGQTIINFMVEMFKKHSINYNRDFDKLMVLKNYNNGFFVKENLPKFVLGNIIRTEYFSSLSSINKKILDSLIMHKQMPALREILESIKVKVLGIETTVYYVNEEDIKLLKEIANQDGIGEKIEYKKDEGLIDGFTIKTTAKIIDFSIAAKIRNLKYQSSFNGKLRTTSHT